VLMYPSSSLKVFDRPVGMPGALATVAMVCRAGVEMDFETGLVGLDIDFVDVEDKDRK